MLIRGNNEFVFVFVGRDLEWIGTGTGAATIFNLPATPADQNLDGSVTITDVSVFVGTSRSTAVAATVSAISESGRTVTLTTAPASGAHVYITWMSVLGHLTYAQEYEFSGEGDTEEILPLSQDTKEVTGIAWGYSGSITLWDFGAELQRTLIAGIDQTVNTANTFANTPSIPTPRHHFIFRKTSGTRRIYHVLRSVILKNFNVTASGGSISEVTADLSANGFMFTYTPTIASGL